MSVEFEVFHGFANPKFHVELQKGLCGTDLHTMPDGRAIGHEGVGIVRQLGSAVTSVKIGDRIGFGYTHSSCGTCQACITGFEQFCENRLDFFHGDDDVGSLSSGAVWNSNNVFVIPDGYDSAYAGPILCAGATVWNVLTNYGIKPSDRVGIMGIGGLGHMAIKLASALGLEVVVFSSSESKKEEAFQYGASEFHVFKGTKPESLDKPLNHLLLCSSGIGEVFPELINMMSFNGSIYPITVGPEVVPIHLTSLLPNGIRIQGVLTGSKHSIEDLFKFVARHNIKPTIQTFPMTAEGVQTAIDTLVAGKMRYRGVLIR